MLNCPRSTASPGSLTRSGKPWWRSVILLYLRVSSTWRHLEHIVYDSGCMAHSVMSDCIHGAHVSFAFVQGRFLDQLHTPPWSLAQGGITANVRQPAHTDLERLDPWCGRKAKLLYDNGDSSELIVFGLKCLHGISWSTIACEQGHASRRNCTSLPSISH